MWNISIFNITWISYEVLIKFKGGDQGQRKIKKCELYAGHLPNKILEITGRDTDIVNTVRFVWLCMTCESSLFIHYIQNLYVMETSLLLVLHFVILFVRFDQIISFACVISFGFVVFSFKKKGLFFPHETYCMDVNKFKDKKYSCIQKLNIRGPVQCVDLLGKLQMCCKKIEIEDKIDPNKI